MGARRSARLDERDPIGRLGSATQPRRLNLCGLRADKDVAIGIAKAGGFFELHSAATENDRDVLREGLQAMPGRLCGSWVAAVTVWATDSGQLILVPVNSWCEADT